jgi:excisionase family DNA binding protein
MKIRMNIHASSRADDIQFVTVPQAARLLSVHVSTVRRWIHDGKLPAYRVGEKGVRVTRADVLDLASPMGTAARKDDQKTRAEALGIRPITDQERDEALAAANAARLFRERLQGQYDEDGPQGWEILNESRDERTADLMRATES